MNSTNTTNIEDEGEEQEHRQPTINEKLYYINMSLKQVIKQLQITPWSKQQVMLVLNC